MKSTKITSWSFSRYADYKNCPLKFKLKHVDKLNEPPNEAMARGAAIHTLAEEYIKGKGRTVPPELKLFEAVQLAEDLPDHRERALLHVEVHRALDHELRLDSRREAEDERAQLRAIQKSEMVADAEQATHASTNQNDDATQLPDLGHCVHGHCHSSVTSSQASAEQAFYMVGTIDEAFEKAKKI